MKKTTNKIVLIGAGAVGTSFLYSAINQGVAEEYGIIDLNAENAEGQKLDLEDAAPALSTNARITSGGYEQVKDADILVITAGRPQFEGETRLEMVSDNARIMKDIAEKVMAEGFDGITVIASNPVDVMTQVYQEVTNFPVNKVISSSCSLDTSRLRVELANVFGVNPTSVWAFVMGEHGDSSVSTFSHGTIAGISIRDLAAEKGMTDSDLAELHKKVYKKAYEIINRKRATFYGIGNALAEITKSILRDEKKIFAVGTKLDGQYGVKNVYMGIPSVVGANGVEKTYEIPLSAEEKKQFIKSSETLTEAMNAALKAIK